MRWLEWLPGRKRIVEPGLAERLAEQEVIIRRMEQRYDADLRRGIGVAVAGVREQLARLVKIRKDVLLDIALGRDIEVEGINDASLMRLYNERGKIIGLLLEEGDRRRNKLIVQEAEVLATKDTGIAGLPWAVYVVGKQVYSSSKFNRKSRRLGFGDKDLEMKALDCCGKNEAVVETIGRRSLRLVPYVTGDKNSKPYVAFAYVGHSESKKASKTIPDRVAKIMEGVGNVLKDLRDVPLGDGGEYATE